jgi:hypothetical protein
VERGKQLSATEHEFSTQIEAIESAYEFMLAYAAQGRESDKGTSGRSEFRDILASLAEALVELQNNPANEDSPAAFQDFAETLASDASHAGRAVELVVSQPRISSQLVDNLNASIHVRAVLTDLFLIDEAFKCR